MTMPLPITSLFAAILALMLIVLSFIVSSARNKTKTNLGDGGNAMLLSRIRAQGNFVEYVPMALIVMGLCEMADTFEPALWAMGVALLAGRLAHAAGMIVVSTPLRAIGMLLTYLAMLAGIWRLLSVFFS